VEHDGDVRFKSGSGNKAVSCMHNASGHNYRNSLFIVDLAMEQIPRSRERISSLFYCSGKRKAHDKNIHETAESNIMRVNVDCFRQRKKNWNCSVTK